MGSEAYGEAADECASLFTGALAHMEPFVTDRGRYAGIRIREASRIDTIETFGCHSVLLAEAFLH